MKSFVMGLSLLLSLPVWGESLPTISKVSCSGKNSDFSLLAEKTTCQDSRYEKWQINGCYKVVITTNKQNSSLEMVRAVPFDKEVIQKFYSFMTFNSSEAVMQGLLLEMAPKEGQLPRFRFDTRENDEGPFSSTYGNCEFVAH